MKDAEFLRKITAELDTFFEGGIVAELARLRQIADRLDKSEQMDASFTPNDRTVCGVISVDPCIIQVMGKEQAFRRSLEGALKAIFEAPEDRWDRLLLSVEVYKIPGAGEADAER